MIKNFNKINPKQNAGKKSDTDYFVTELFTKFDLSTKVVKNG
ncbi:MAG: hypothetical protein K0S26_1487 [Bacteroidota bacterium]|jgi:hypothetical protein|nr:hypothetical protein [Bacteroidota bacterium]